MAKFDRLPNGFGNINKLSGKLRNPYCARKVIGKDENGKKKWHYVGYFATWKEAFEALQKFDETKLPTELTFREVYERMCQERYGNEKTDGRKHMNSAFNHCLHLADKKLKDITLEEIEQTKEDKTDSAKKRIREMWHSIYDYAMRFDLVFKDLSRNTRWKINTKPKINAQELTEDLFDPAQLARYILPVPRCDSKEAVMIMLYTGMRPSEVLELKLANVSLKDRRMIGGLKTEAGIDRRIPIAKDLMNLICTLMIEAKEAGRETLMPKMAYNTLLNKYKAEMPLMAAKHSMRDLRRFVITTCRQNGIDKDILYSFVGHAPDDVEGKHYFKPQWSAVLDEYDRCMKVSYKVDMHDTELYNQIKQAEANSKIIDLKTALLEGKIEL